MGRLGDAILDFFFPPKCVFCGKLLGRDEAEICCKCRLDLPFWDAPVGSGTFYTAMTAVFNYEGLVRESLHRYKFGGMEQYAPCYGKLVAASVSAKLAGPFDLVTWTPVSKKRRRKRGYDQAELLAKAVAKQLQLPPAATLVKTRNNPAQSGLAGAEKRHANVLGVYAASDPAAVMNKHILLIDDITTTGATLEEASRILLTAGAAAVSCGVLAAKGRK